jgi:hypothetical protein
MELPASEDIVEPAPPAKPPIVEPVDPRVAAFDREYLERQRALGEAFNRRPWLLRSTGRCPYCRSTFPEKSMILLNKVILALLSQLAAKMRYFSG